MQSKNKENNRDTEKSYHTKKTNKQTTHQQQKTEIKAS